MDWRRYGEAAATAQGRENRMMFGFGARRAVRAWIDSLSEAAGERGAPGEQTPPEHLAGAALLVAAARSDEDYSEHERALIGGLLASAYGLSEDQAAALRAEAEAAQAQAVDTQRFTRQLNESLTPEERIEFLSQVWRVVLADRRRDPQEDALMRKLAGLLYVPDVDNATARHRAQRAIGAADEDEQS